MGKSNDTKIKKIEIVKVKDDFRVIETKERLGNERGIISVQVLYSGTRKECQDYLNERRKNNET